MSVSFVDHESYLVKYSTTHKVDFRGGSLGQKYSCPEK